MYDIRTNDLEHEGDAEFHETVLIRAQGGPALLVKRWGAIAQKNGGGQIGYERGSHEVVVAEEQKILGEKRSKGYRNANGSGSLRFAVGADGDSHELYAMAKFHYGRDTARYIKEFFGAGAGAVADAVVEEPSPKESEVPIWCGLSKKKRTILADCSL